MAKINPYITFDGNCEEAFNFYKSVFGGEFVFFGRFSEMPENLGIGEDEKNKIMHVSLPIGNGETILMGSDKGENMGLPHNVGNNFSMSIGSDSKEEAEQLFSALAEGGNITMPMSNTFWGSYFGTLTDKYGIQWMVSFGQ